MSSTDVCYVISEASHNEKLKEFPPNCKTYAIRTKEWKYICRKHKEELYNLKKDPKETNNVCNEEKGVVKTFQSILREHIEKEKTHAERELIKAKLNKLSKIGKL
ncbi:MAG: DUF4976 domain-containing protein [Thermoplasmatales archaeon]|nr:DUF4976 domain-containing protein [Thermoplasmatales archaeon]